ncbi:Ig-like domain-containing protein [Brevibacillus thermoruber]|uniref:Ig-like domain-containing protein n=1 Tax=Brevibacillus thermoruber TaxID=33942 RepID=UPI00054E757F|nr:Ig-like domain-containing protein [Brevibacillus thermoruber]
MNKKVVLSVLSATFVASVASSAFAAPKDGLYIGGNVDKYYSIETLFGLTAEGKAQFGQELAGTDFNNLVFVDFDGKGASIQEILDNGLDKAKQDPLVADDFEASYSIAKADGTVDGTYDARKDVDGVTPGELKVESVSAINAKQLEVKFGVPVDEDTVISNGNLVNTAFQKNGVDLSGTNPAELSKDGKTLTITLGSGTWEGTYLFSVKKNSVKSTDGEFIAAYDEKVSYEDTVAPTLVDTETVNATTVKVKFSEPIKSFGTITAKLADGTDLSSAVAAGASIDGNAVKFNLNASGIPAGKAITVSLAGVTDHADNLVTPNPVTTTFTKGTLDGVAPTITAVTPVNAKKFELKFSEEVEGLTVDDIEVNGSALVPGTDKLTQDKTDKTKYVVELAAPQQGLVTISIAAGKFTDLSGESNAAFSKIVNFTTDTVSPTLASATVDKKDGKEVLTLTFSEDVTVAASGLVTASAKKVVDYITSTVNLTFDAGDLTPVKGKANQFTIELSKVSDSATTTLTEGATYTVDLPASLVRDTAGNANEAKAKAFTFTRGTDADTKAPALDKTYDSGETGNRVASNGILVVDNDTIKVKFDRAVDGASATNPANYKVSGATVEDVTLTAGNVVEIKLAADSNTFTGLRTVEISGVKSKDGVVMEPYTTSEYLVENVRPTVKAVDVTSITQDDPATTGTDESETVVTLTFSESVTPGTGDTADFDLYIKGVKVTGVTISTAAGASSDKIEVTIGKELTEKDFTDGVTLKAKSTADIADANGNKANFDSEIPVHL